MSNVADITLVIKVIADNTQVDKFNASLMRTAKAQSYLEQANTKLSKSYNPLMTHFANLSDKLGRAERQMDAVFRAGMHMKSMGNDLMRTGKQIAGFAQGIVETYAEYDFVLRQTALALNTNTEWQGKLDKAIQGTAITLGKFSPKEVAAAYRIWGAATGDVVDSQSSLARISKTVTDIMMATAMVGGTLETNLQGVYGITQQYSLGLGKASYVTKVLSLLTERTALNFGDLASAFVYAGSYTGAIGVKFEDVAQALGVMADAGFRGSKAGRGLSMFFEAITAPSGPAKKALDSLARSMGAVNWKKWVFPKGKFEGMRDLITKIAGGLEKMTPIQRAAFLAQAGSNNAVRAALPLIKQQIALWDKQRKAGQELTSILDEQKYSLKTADQFFSQMSSSFLSSFDSLIGSFKNSFFPIIQLIAIQIMKFAGPIMKQMSAGLAKLAKWMELNPGFTEVAVKIGAIAVVVMTLVGAVLVALGTMAFFYANLILVAAGLIPLVTMFTTLAAVFVGFAVKIATNTGGITDALSHLLESFKRIFDVITGGASTASALKDIATAVNAVINAGVGVVADAIEAIADALDSLSPDQIMLVRDAGAALLAIVALNTGMGIAASAIGAIGLALTTFAVEGAGIRAIGMPGIFAKMFGSLGPLVAAIGMVIEGLGILITAINPVVWAILAIGAAVAAFFYAYSTNFMGFKDIVDGVIAWFAVELPKAIGGALTVIGGLVSGLLAPITEHLPAMVAFLQGIAQQLGDTWIPILQSLADTAIAVFGNIVTAFLQVVDNVMPHIQPMVDELMKLVTAIVDFLGPAWNGLVVIVGVVVGGIIQLVVYLANTIAPVVQGFADHFMRAFGVLSEFLIRIVGVFVTGIIDNIRSFATIIRGIIDVFTGVLTGNWDRVWKGLNTIVTGVLGLIQTAITGFIGIVQEIIRLGLNVITGLFEFVFGMKPGSILAGVNSFITTFVGNIIKFANSVVKTISGIPGKMADIGNDIVTGLWNGINQMKNWITNKMWDFIKSVIPGPVLDALGIHSPSRVMAAIGVNIIEGLAQGILRTSAAYDAMVAQAAAISDVATGVMEGQAMTLATAPIRASSYSDATKTINLNVDVTSGDGSVNGVDLGTLSDLITSSDMVRTLERMASID